MLHISISQLLGGNYYMIFFIAAVLTGVVFAGIAAIKSNFGVREFAAILSAGILGLLIGSKLVLFDSAQWNDLFSNFHLPIENGKSTIGALLGLMFGLWVAARLLGKTESVLNLFAISIPLGLAVQGFGCLSAGCCHGSLTNVPWGITYGPETRPFVEQLRLGLIPSDAGSTLAIHPSQFYAILACLLIAFIIWKTRSFWKSPSGSFIFSIILYLLYRVIEEISGYSLPTRDWMGMTTLMWKGLILLLFTLLLIYRERNYDATRKPVRRIVTSATSYNLKIFTIAFITMLISLLLGDWFTAEERMLILLIVFPLCGLVILEKICWSLRSLQFTRTSLIVLLAFVLMSQKADIPPGTPKSYSSINLTSAFGKFINGHSFNERTEEGCDGYYWASDIVGYQHDYVTGGLGFSRKIYYNEWESILVSLNVLKGTENETPKYNPYQNLNPSKFKNQLWSINPAFQYDGRGFGLGLGGSFGKLGFDKEGENTTDRKDYNPEDVARDFALQGRLRLFSERYFFLEILAGYDAGATGEYNWQALGGSRFNTDKYMLKAGFAFTEHSSPSFVFKGEMPLVSNLFLSPQFIIYKKNEHDMYENHGYRAVIGLEYRFYEKDKSNLK